jgi:hypothetical protein
MIDRSKFVRECVRSALYFGVHAHYLVAVAQFRSGITEGGDGERYGPFRLTTAEWDAHRTDATFDLNFRSNDIMSWELQCPAFAAMTAGSQDALSKRLGRMPSAVELYLTQWPAAEPQTLAPDLQAALDGTADLMGPAFEEFDEFMDSVEPGAGTVVGDVSQKIGETECLEFTVDEARVKELQHTFRNVGSSHAADEEQTIDLLIFTTRKWEEADVSFNDERSAQVGFATARVRVPQNWTGGASYDRECGRLDGLSTARGRTKAFQYGGHDPAGATRIPQRDKWRRISPGPRFRARIPQYAGGLGFPAGANCMGYTVSRGPYRVFMAIERSAPQLSL